MIPIALAPFEPADFSRLITWVPSAEFMMQWSGPFFTHPLDEAQLDCYYQSGQSEPPIRKIYKAVDISTAEVVGHIELNNIDRRNLAATVSKVLVAPHRQGQGIGTAMTAQLLKIAFEQLRLHRVSLYVFDFNLPAVHCYQKLGFTQEGHLRDFRKVGDTYWSSYVMAILEDEWRSRQNA